MTVRDVMRAQGAAVLLEQPLQLEPVTSKDAARESGGSLTQRRYNRSQRLAREQADQHQRNVLSRILPEGRFRPYVGPALIALGIIVGEADKQRLAGKLDAGLRGAVTGGGHLDGVRDLIADLFRVSLPTVAIRRTAGIVLPGYYRPTKKWDLVVVHRGTLVAAIELKSQVGPSFGNNVNNRSEEAIGNAVDVWRAYEAGTFGDVRPWLGYVFVLEEARKSTTAVGLAKTVFPVEPIFQRTSYKDRYEILCDRLVKERLYDAAWFLTATADGEIDEPNPALSFASFSAAIAGRVAYVDALV